ncbi:MAG: helix-turn-helix domain-containing protein [Clostridiaceae bacterium]
MFFSDISVKRHFKIKEASNHIYILPHSLLRKYIAHYTISFSSENKMAKDIDDIGNITLIPDSSGCIIYTFEDTGFSSSLWGATTKVVSVKNDVNLKKVRFFIEFMPGGLHAITGINQSELCDIKPRVDEVDKTLSFLLVQAMESSNNLDDMISRVNMILLKEIEKKNRYHSVISSSLDRINSNNKILTITELASKEYISQRQLNRLFNQYIGINAKMFLRIVRVNHSIKMLKKLEYKNYLDLVQRLDYFDQSHFIYDFKQICGVSPSIFLKNMSDFYNEQFKH